jgi:hypothetical protein
VMKRSNSSKGVAPACGVDEQFEQDFLKLKKLREEMRENLLRIRESESA